MLYGVKMCRSDNGFPGIVWDNKVIRLLEFVFEIHSTISTSKKIVEIE